MKRMFILLTGCCFALTTLAQTDTTKTNESDTIRVGGMIIIKKGKTNGDEYEEITVHHRKNDYKPSNISTNWFIFDLGFANFNDQTDYKAGNSMLGPGVGEDQFDLRTGKSVNVNIWFFMQKLNITKHVVNLKYGLGIETNNYRFEDGRVKYLKSPTQIVLDTIDHNKNKLAVDYITIPLMLNFNFTPRREEGFGLSFGVSAGYRYSSRQKFKDDGEKVKTHGSFDLEPWKISYIAELQFGPVKFYGSYAAKSMYKNGLDHTPYNMGIRFSNW